jgi:hypothetical protein
VSPWAEQVGDGEVRAISDAVASGVRERCFNGGWVHVDAEHGACRKPRACRRGLSGNIHLMSLELRPICEHCAVDLPPSALNAMICSFECTFCSECVDQVLQNVCPNCGGGLQHRPIRPVTNWKGENNLAHHPASSVPHHRPVDVDAHDSFASIIARIHPEDR